jgi:putative ABC transport system permease protein
VRLADIFAMALAALWRHKARTTLTVLGVSIGSFALVASLSVGQGVEAALYRIYRQNDRLRKIYLYQGWDTKEGEVPPDALIAKGTMDDAKRKRLRKALLRQWEREHASRPRPVITKARLNEIARMEHVEAVTPTVQMNVKGFHGGRERDVFAVGAVAGDRSVGSRVVVGNDLGTGTGRKALVHEALLYQWGIADDDAVRQVIGTPIRLEFHVGRPGSNAVVRFLTGGVLTLSGDEESTLDRALKRLPDALDKSDLTVPERDALKKALRTLESLPNRIPSATYVEEFTIVGVVREWDEGDEPIGHVGWAGPARFADVILPIRAAEAFYLRAPQAAEEGFNQAVVTVDREENIKELHKAFVAMGLNVFSLADVIDTVRTNVLLISFTTAFVAVVALVVAALGITNTMVMSVLERTREIGVMKAVGARDRHVMLLFLVEGAAIGGFGGLFGLLFAWLASFPGDAVARSIMEAQTKAPLAQSLFVFPAWIVLGVPAAAAGITVLAALYPARRAAKLDPIASLRHE